MPKILIVEDDTDIVENLSVLLQDEGFLYCHASDTKTALDMLRTENIDLVLLDITLPDGNGYSVCTAVKRMTNQQHIREFTEYVDASINSLAHELKQWVPAVVDERIAQTKVQMDVDEPSMKKVKSKLNELFSSLGIWGK